MVLSFVNGSGVCSRWSTIRSTSGVRSIPFKQVAMVSGKTPEAGQVFAFVSHPYTKSFGNERILPRNVYGFLGNRFRNNPCLELSSYRLWQRIGGHFYYWRVWKRKRHFWKRGWKRGVSFLETRLGSDRSFFD